ncbi:hypothetical protein MIR68_010826 [Amoeboaphelidium protococcarum]|nr:hypothetical protein MIR68_010826 [Amoeboaphelidium protococcarum]KAI3642165.1 hypothetical protein MP228_011720 [Amoeboaphelidium protococcarum]
MADAIKSKKLCAFADCQSKPAKIVGDCKFCSASFCSRHRTVEAHACANIDQCKAAHFQRNEAKLLKEKTAGVKVAM